MNPSILIPDAIPRSLGMVQEFPYPDVYPYKHHVRQPLFLLLSGLQL